MSYEIRTEIRRVQEDGSHQLVYILAMPVKSEQELLEQLDAVAGHTRDHFARRGLAGAEGLPQMKRR